MSAKPSQMASDASNKATEVKNDAQSKANEAANEVKANGSSSGSASPGKSSVARVAEIPVVKCVGPLARLVLTCAVTR